MLKLGSKKYWINEHNLELGSLKNVSLEYKLGLVSQNILERVSTLGLSLTGKSQWSLDSGSNQGPSRPSKNQIDSENFRAERRLVLVLEKYILKLSLRSYSGTRCYQSRALAIKNNRIGDNDFFRLDNFGIVFLNS